MGAVHARVYGELGSVELWVFDREPDKASALAKRFEGSAANSFEALLDSVDAVDLCVPTDVHAELALAAVAAGKAVLCEKPLARTLDEARALVLAARASSRPFMTAHVARFFPDYRRLHEAVVSGAVGRPAAVRLHRGGGVPKAPWFMDHSRSGGVLLDAAVHDFDWLLWTFGPVLEVSARSRSAAVGEGADYALTTLTFESGVVAHVESTWLDPDGFRTTAEIAGSEGLIQHDSRSAASLRVSSGGRVAYEMNVAFDDDPYYLQAQAFVAAVRDGVATPVDVEDGYRAMAVALAAMESASTGRRVRPAALP
jgi:predicted dehydrogenase